MIDVISCAKNVLNTEIDGLVLLRDSLSESFSDAVHLIRSCKGHLIVTGVGKPGHIGRKMAATFSSTGTKSFFIHPTEAAHGDLGTLSEHGDVLLILSLSGQTEELLPLLAYATRFGINIIAITGNPDSQLAKAAAVTILLPKMEEACPNKLAPTTSSTAMLAVGDALAVCLVKMNDFSKEDFKKLHPGGTLGKKLLKAKNIMHTNLPIVSENDFMKDVLIVMTQLSFGCAAVVDNASRLVGIITDGDLRRHLDQDFINKRASEIMTRNPIIADEDIFLSEAMKLLNEKKITSIFITDDQKKPIGIVHIHDCLRMGIK